MRADLQTDRRPRDHSLLDADHLAAALRCCLLVHLSDGVAAFSRRAGIWTAILGDFPSTMLFVRLNSGRTIFGPRFGCCACRYCSVAD